MTVFALAPGRLSTDLIDYSTPEGSKHYRRETEPTRELYNGTQQGFSYFISQVLYRVHDFGWEDICEITLTGTATKKDLIKHYGQYTIRDVLTTAAG